MDYLQMVHMAGPEESSHTVDRSRSIFELMDERNHEFSKMENLSEPQRESFSTQYSNLSKKTTQIVVTEKVQVMFHTNDPIFTRSKAIDESEYEV